jgi:glycosyltransferase involved in cell wall biosynthesis
MKGPSVRIGINSQVLGIGVRHGFSTYLDNVLRALRARHGAHQFVEWACESGPHWRLPDQLWWDQALVPWRAFQDHVDLVHVPAFSGPVVRTCPLVLTVHDLLYTRYPEWLPTRRARWYWRQWIPFTARRATAVIVPSMATRNDVVELAGVPPERVSVVPEALAPQFGTVPPVQEVEAYRIGKGWTDPYLLYVGSIDRRKDWRGLVQAFALLRAAGHAVRLVIAGTVSRQRAKPLLQEIARSAAGREITLTGYVPDEELPLLYAGASLFVYPSWWEGFGLPPLEAMAMGVPVITYRRASLPEVVGDAAVLIEEPFSPEALAEAMRRLLIDDAWRQTLMARGYRRATHFSWDMAADQTMAVYKRCLAA